MHISFNEIKKGQYKLLVRQADTQAKHKHTASHKKEGVFRFEVADAQAEELEAGFIQQNKWMFYLAFAGVLIFLLANWYRNRA